MQALFINMQYELDERMVAIACMISVKEPIKALRDMNRKKDVPSAVAPMWRVVKFTEEGSCFSSICSWQEMVSVHGKLTGAPTFDF